MEHITFILWVLGAPLVAMAINLLNKKAMLIEKQLNPDKIVEVVNPQFHSDSKKLSAMILFIVYIVIAIIVF